MAVGTPEQYDRVNRWGAWTPVEPAWTGSSTNPVIDNGEIAGSCRRNGSVGHYRGAITMGSGTTYGSGGWRVALPDGWTASATITNGYQVGLAMLNDTGTNTHQGWCYVAAGGTILLFVHGSPWANVTSSAPFTWTTGDFLTWNIKLELEAPTYT